jgi:hypothetical protein
MKKAIKYILNPRLTANFIYENFLLKLVPKKITARKYLGSYISYSQAFQDVFVREMLRNKHGGVYVEVGAYDEIDSSNTYILEDECKWSGISLEIDKIAVKDFNAKRINKCICVDATKFDYEEYFLNNMFPKQIDYLSLDIEPAHQTLQVLNALPLDKYRFSVITYEHDRYVSGPSYMNESRKIFELYGYKLVVSNVAWNGRDFEDWYVDPNVVPEEIWKPYNNSDIDCLQVFRKSGFVP